MPKIPKYMGYSEAYQEQPLDSEIKNFNYKNQKSDFRDAQISNFLQKLVERGEKSKNFHNSLINRNASSSIEQLVANNSTFHNRKKTVDVAGGLNLRNMHNQEFRTNDFQTMDVPLQGSNNKNTNRYDTL